MVKSLKKVASMEPKGQYDDRWMTFGICLEKGQISFTFDLKDLANRLAQAWASGERYRTGGPLVENEMTLCFIRGNSECIFIGKRKLVLWNFSNVVFFQNG